MDGRLMDGRSASRLEIDIVEMDARRVQINVRGDLDVITNTSLREALTSLYLRSSSWIAVDLSGARLKDSAALVTLIAARRRLAARGCTLTVSGLGTSATQLFARAGLSATRESA